MNILLVWCESFDDVKLFLLRISEKEIFEKILAANHQYLYNGEEDTRGAKFVEEWLRVNTPAPYEGSAPLQISGEFTVVVSGYGV
jgi:hypothetical protein